MNSSTVPYHNDTFRENYTDFLGNWILPEKHNRKYVQVSINKDQSGELYDGQSQISFNNF